MPAPRGRPRTVPPRAARRRPGSSRACRPRLATITGLLPVLGGTVIVTIPSDVSHLVVRKSITVASQAKAPVLGLVENMTGMFRGPAGVDLAREAGVPFLGSVPFDPELAVAADRGEAFVASAPTRDSAHALVDIARAI